jgi:diguanylate cyclase
MEHVENIEETQDLATKALTFLGEQKLAPVPNNYAVAYSFFARSHPDLNSQIEKQIADGGIGPSDMAALYDAFFGLETESIVLRSAGEMIEGIVANLRQTADAAGDDAAGYGKVLQEFSDKVAAGQPNAVDLLQAINFILAETQAMESRNSDLEKEFARSGEEVTKLRRNLDEMRLAAHTDALTGIANRRHFDTRFKEIVAHAAANDEPISVLMADIDFFKNVNDCYGHQVGDHVLRLVSVAISQSVRGRDFVARFGGEEFAVILPRTELAGALAVAENIRDSMASKRLTWKATGEALGAVTLSLGAAQYRDDESTDDLIRRADKGLYIAKHKGRNRVETTESIGDALWLNSIVG